jgi:hypothetical protein
MDVLEGDRGRARDALEQLGVSPIERGAQGGVTIEYGLRRDARGRNIKRGFDPNSEEDVIGGWVRIRLAAKPVGTLPLCGRAFRDCRFRIAPQSCNQGDFGAGYPLAQLCSEGTLRSTEAQPFPLDPEGYVPVA